MILARLPRARRLRRRALAASMIGVPLLTSGCGPSVPVQLGMKNVPLDVTVGNDVATRPPAPHAPAAPPVAEALPVIVAAATPAPAVQNFTPPPPLVVGSGEVCPELDRTKASPAAATPEVDEAATPGRWPQRSGGTLNVAGALLALPTEGTWAITVPAGQTTQGVYTFNEQGMFLGFPGALTAYKASNSTSAPANPLVSPTSSFGLTQFIMPFTGGAFVYNPANPLKLLATPAAQNSTYQPDPNNPAIPNTTGTWTDTQTDPTNGSSMTIQATDNGHVRVNACGTPVDAWQVQATLTITGTTIFTGSTPTPAKTDLTLAVTYAVATGLGGMIVDEQVKTVPNPDGQVSYFAGVPFSDTSNATLSAPKPEAS